MYIARTGTSINYYQYQTIALVIRIKINHQSTLNINMCKLLLDFNFEVFVTNSYFFVDIETLRTMCLLL